METVWKGKDLDAVRALPFAKPVEVGSYVGMRPHCLALVLVDVSAWKEPGRKEEDDLPPAPWISCSLP